MTANSEQPSSFEAEVATRLRSAAEEAAAQQWSFSAHDVFAATSIDPSARHPYRLPRSRVVRVVTSLLVAAVIAVIFFAPWPPFHLFGSSPVRPTSGHHPSTSTTVPGWPHPPQIKFATGDVSPVVLSFSDPAHGLLLVQGCKESICYSWVETSTDGGEHWQSQSTFVAYPATDYIKVQGVAIENPAPNPNRFGVDALAFASARDGWAYGPGLFVTHDGGQQFRRVKVSADVLAVAASAGRVWVLEQRCSPVTKAGTTVNACTPPVLLTGPADGDTLSPVVNQPPGFSLEGGGYEGSQFPTEIVYADSNLEVLAGVSGLDVTTDGGRTWRQSRYPCRNLYATSDRQPGSVAVDPSGSLWLICSEGPTAGFQPKQLWRSFDAGQSWLGPHQLASLGYADTVVPVSSTEAWDYGSRAPIFHSTDSGHSWKTMLASRFSNTGGPQGFSAIGADDAWIVAPPGSTPFPTELLRTTNGGSTWSVVQLQTPTTQTETHLQGSIAGTLLRVGGPEPGSAVPVRGQVTAESSAGVKFTVTVGNNGRFVLSLPAGAYQLTGHSPTVLSNRVEMTCVATHPVRVRVGHEARGVEVVCSIS